MVQAPNVKRGKKSLPPLTFSNADVCHDVSPKPMSERLQEIWQAMVGVDVDCPIDLESPQALALNVAGINFAAVYRQIGGMIDAYAGNQTLLDKSGLDDLLYQLTVQLKHPEAFLSKTSLSDANNLSRTNGAHRLDRLCQYIKANLGKRLAMSELEIFSQTSARSLQHQFQRRFGCSPTRWITQQRLLACREHFLRAESNETVTSIAFALGFTNVSYFARLYFEFFGERPSETLRKS